MVHIYEETYKGYTDNERGAADFIEKYKEEQIEKGYVVKKSKVDYKVKKDRKTGEIIEEKWYVEVTISYEV